MKDPSITEVGKLVKEEFENSLESLLRKGARKMLCAALEMEVEEYIESCKDRRDERGRCRSSNRGQTIAERDIVSAVGYYRGT